MTQAVILVFTETFPQNTINKVDSKFITVKQQKTLYLQILEIKGCIKLHTNHTLTNAT